MNFLILALAVWRLSSLLVEEEGPFLVFVRLRTRAGIEYDDYSERIATTELAKIFNCVWCMSVWVGIFTVIFYWIWPEAIYWIAMPLALSAAAILLDRWAKGEGCEQ